VKAPLLSLLLLAVLAVGGLAWLLARGGAPETPPAPVVAQSAARPEAVSDTPALERTMVAPEGLAPDSPPLEALRAGGRVVDLAGQPLCGLAVAVRGDEREPALAVRSDADGRFVLAVEELPCEFEVVEAGWCTVRFGIAQDALALDETRVVAARAASLSGRVLERSGHPLAEATLVVRLDAGSAEFFARSGGDGRFRFEQLPSLPKLELRTTLEGWRSDERVLPLPFPEELQVVLEPADSQGPLLEGTVLRPDGMPAPGALVTLGAARARSGEAGHFRLHCGWCTAATPLVACASGFQPAVLAGYGARVDALAQTLPPVELQLAGPALAIAGKLVGADGAPLKGWHVQLADPTALDPGGDARECAEGRVELRSDARGAFEFGGLCARAYTLLASGRERGSRVELILRSQAVPAGTRDLLLRAPANAGVRLLVGRVLDENGAALGDAGVGFGRVSGGGRVLARSDPAGHFEIADAPPGTLYLVATHAGCLPLRMELAPAARSDALTLRLASLRPFRFESTDSAQAPDRICALGADGIADLWALGGTLPVRAGSVRLRGGRSGRLSAGPEAREIVLYRGLRELARLPAPPRSADLDAETLLRWP